MEAEIIIEDYKPEYRSSFKTLNAAWLEQYFYIEPVDEFVLENPEAAILDDGGKILFARYKEEVIGTVALKKMEHDCYELTKMAVAEKRQGVGAGKLLCRAAIEKARSLGAVKVMLYSQTKLEAALAIYRKMGFKDIPLGEGKYERADVKMELYL